MENEKNVYRVTIEKIGPKDDKGYAKNDKLFEQTVEQLDIQNLVGVINGLNIRPIIVTK